MKYIFLSINIFLVIFLISSNSLAIDKNHNYEETNRSIHNFNDSIDQNILRPTSKVYGLLPDFIEIGFSNIISNLSEPSNFINHLFQGEINSSFLSLGRLTINTTIGVVGIFDVANKMGIKKVTTDFGKTLNIWGFNEGQYLVIPFIGPRTTRHFVGTIADAVFNPVNYSLRDEDSIVRVSPSMLFLLSSRSSNDETIDNLRSTSIDYYSSLRSIYLQNRGINISEDLENDVDFFDEDFDDEDIFFPEVKK